LRRILWVLVEVVEVADVFLVIVPLVMGLVWSISIMIMKYNYMEIHEVAGLVTEAAGKKKDVPDVVDQDK
jgi:hypothetical protein